MAWLEDLINLLKGNNRQSTAAELQGYLHSGDFRNIQGMLSGTEFMSPEREKWLDNMIANQNTEEARVNEREMRDTDYLSVGSQLEQLGLSSSGVLQTGASHQNVAAADNVKSNVALQKYGQKMAIAKQLLGMTSQMASAGIYGSAIGAAKKASGVLTSAAAHSAYGALNAEENEPYTGPSRAELLKMLED